MKLLYWLAACLKKIKVSFASKGTDSFFQTPKGFAKRTKYTKRKDEFQGAAVSQMAIEYCLNFFEYSIISFRNYYFNIFQRTNAEPSKITATVIAVAWPAVNISPLVDISTMSFD